MILQGDSDTAYLVCPEARSRLGGYLYLGNKALTQFNGPVLVLAKVIKNVMASAAEAEVGALYTNAQEILPMRQCLEELGHKQPATPLKTDNSTAQGIINNTMKQKRSKAMDMRFYWLRDRILQRQFHIYWEPGKHNLADLPTKHHAGSNHIQVRPIYLYNKDTSPVSIQGCVKLLSKPKKVQSVHQLPGPKSPEIAYLCQLSHTEPRPPSAQHKPLGPNRHSLLQRIQLTAQTLLYNRQQLSRKITYNPHNIE